jgi:hypothetical protein
MYFAPISRYWQSDVEKMQDKFDLMAMEKRPLYSAEQQLIEASELVAMDH